MTYMSCASEKIIVEVSRHTSEYVNLINVIHDVSSIFYAMTNNHARASILPKVSIVVAT